MDNDNHEESTYKMNFISCRIWSVCMFHIVRKLYGLNSYFLFFFLHIDFIQAHLSKSAKKCLCLLGEYWTNFHWFSTFDNLLNFRSNPDSFSKPNLTWLMSIQSSTQLVNFNINYITILFLGNTVFVTFICKLLDPLFIFCFISTTVHLVFKINLSIFLFVTFLNFFIKNIF